VPLSFIPATTLQITGGAIVDTTEAEQ
jgi:hypothetical protein